MIDPDGIMLTESKLPSEIKMGLVPECDFLTYDLDDDKSFKTYISDIEKEVRGSFEYRQLIRYLKENMGMDHCAILQEAHYTERNKIRVEIHHYPFSLYDICDIVYKKRVFYKEPLELEMVAKEVMLLHYETLVGLIPLSETVHELVHQSKLFIPVTKVYGRYRLFMDYYDPFISPEQKDVVNRIEKYSTEETSELLNTTILDTNNLTFNISDELFAIPSMNNVGNQLVERVQEIKANGYTLPTVHDKPMIEDKKERKPIIKPIYMLDE